MLVEHHQPQVAVVPTNKNQRRVLALLGCVGIFAGLVVLAIVLATGLGWLAALVISLPVAIVVPLVCRNKAWRWLLALLGGQPPTGNVEDSLQTSLEGLCLSHGLAVPQLRVIPEETVNAAAIARSVGDAVIVITSGTLTQLERIELEGLLAHLLCRIRRGDAALDTLAGMLVAWPLAKLAPLRRYLMNKVLPQGRSLHADMDAIALTRYPPGLMRALKTMAANPFSGSSSQVQSATVAALHMWVDELSWGVGDTIRHPTLGIRIAVLEELC